MAAIDEAHAQLVAALKAWDFSPAFPGGYTGTKAVLLVPTYPYELIDNLLSETNGQMTQPVISVVNQHGRSPETHRTFGEILAGDPTVPIGKTRYARRVRIVFQITSWADQIMGGHETAEKLGGQVQGCLFVNKSSLAAYKQLCVIHTQVNYDDHPQIWSMDVWVEGYSLITFDV